MFKLVIEIDLENAAFADHLQIEAARILSDLAETALAYAGLPTNLPLRDINGNTVGFARIVTDEDNECGCDDAPKALMCPDCGGLWMLDEEHKVVPNDEEDARDCDGCGAAFSGGAIVVLHSGINFIYCSEECAERFGEVGDG